MEKMKMKTNDLAQEKFEALRALFPEAVTETLDENGNLVRGIDADQLRQAISQTVVEGSKERYQMTWPGKREAIRLANQPISKTLRPCREESVDFDTTQNLYIEGDNLDALKLLRETYLGKVKMIYIDPPYNTGNDFIYKDDYKQDTGEYLIESGQIDDAGKRMVVNKETNGRFHSDWLSMIYPRLKLAKDLLRDDGVIFISIDDNEQENLKKICNVIFGESNFIAELIWSAGRKNDSKYISISHEYILCYFKNANFIQQHEIIWREKKQGLEDIYSEYDSLKQEYGTDIVSIERELKKWYRALPDGHPAKDHSHYDRVDERGIFFASDISWPGGGGPKYPVLHPVTGNPVRIPSRGWITNEKTMKEWIQQGKVFFGADENRVPTLKSYLNEREYSVPYSVFYKDGRASSKRLATLMGEKVFENPKDEEILARLIEFCGTEDGDIVLDFFSGSASIAHAVFLANINQNKRRHFILVQTGKDTIDPKKSSSEKGKKVANNAIKLLDSLGVPYNICEIGKERIRRAGTKIKSENPLTSDHLDIGFRVLKIDSSNMEDVFYRPNELRQDELIEQSNHIKPDRNAEDLLFQVMLDLGIELSSSIEKIKKDNNTFYSVADHHLIACFDSNITEEIVTEIANYHPNYVVFGDRGFAKDSTAINFEQIFKSLSPKTECRTL